MTRGVAKPKYITPELSGFSDRWQNPATTSGTYSSFVRSYIVQVYWSDVQPVRGGPINWNAPTYNDTNTASGNTILTELALAAAGGYQVRFRLLQGYRSPQWVKDIGGIGGLAWNDSTAPLCTIPRYWIPKIRNEAVPELISKVQPFLDNHPNVGDFAITGATTIFSELGNRQLSDAICVASLKGTKNEEFPFGVPIDKLAFAAAVDACSVFKYTTCTAAMNPYQALDIVTGVINFRDTDTTKWLSTYIRTKLGRLGGFGNHSVKDNRQSGTTGPGMDFFNLTLMEDMYPYWAALGPPFYLQTEPAGRLGVMAYSTPTALANVTVSDYPSGPRVIFGGSALDIAIYFGATAVELPRGYHSNPSLPNGAFVSTAQAAAYMAALNANRFWKG